MDNRSARPDVALPRSPLCALLVLLAFACGGKNKGADEATTQELGDDATSKVDATLCNVADKRVATFDLDRDGRPDVWKLHQHVQEGDTDIEILSCKQVDLDHDGRKDYVVAYTRKGGTNFEKFDFDFDGRFDALFLFDEKSGRLMEVQRDSDFDGRYDLLEVYDENEAVTSIKRDRNADGAPDQWEQYVEGALVAILYDDDFDNRVDRREEVRVKQEPARPSAETPASDDEQGDSEPTAEEPADEPANTPTKTSPQNPGDEPDGQISAPSPSSSSGDSGS